MPESSPTLINDAIRRQVLLEGVKDNEWIKFNKFLKSLERDIRVRLSKEGNTIETKGRLNTLLVDVNKIQRDLLGFRFNPPKDEFTGNRTIQKKYSKPLKYTLPL